LRKQFTNRANAPRLTPEQAERQGSASRRAVEVLGRTDEVIAFLNTHDEALGGRPIDIAVASAEGLSAVEQALAARKAALQQGS
jgi:uncharacterized protein (DUF2384 family)